MVDLKQYSIADLKKTATEINTYLKKAEEKDFDPNESTPDAAHLEDKLGGTSKKIEDSGTETKKADFPSEEPAPENGDGSEEMTAPSQGDAMSQILALLQEILSKIGAPAAPPMPPAPTDQIQQSAEAIAPIATPSTSSPSKSDININVTKAQVEEILKGMGLTPSQVTAKPKVESGHPIGKSANVTFKDISKMSWEELNILDSSKSTSTHY
jgi:hypothetical protein